MTINLIRKEQRREQYLLLWF